MVKKTTGMRGYDHMFRAKHEPVKPASKVRVLKGAEFEKRKRELEAALDTKTKTKSPANF